MSKKGELRQWNSKKEVADYLRLSLRTLDRRIEALSRTATKREHAQEVLRIAALLAQASEDVSQVERDVLAKIAKQCGLEAGAVDEALADVKKALAGAG